jgi:phosphate transport system permease protein
MNPDPLALSERKFESRLPWRKAKGLIFSSLTVTSVLIGILALVALLVNVFSNGKLIVAMRAATEAGLVFSQRALQLGNEVRPYVRVADVLAGSAAERAGLRSGDVLLRAGTKTVQSVADVWGVIERHPPGQPLTLSWILSPENLIGDLRAERDETAGQLRIVLDYLEPTSPAAQAGFQVNDVLVRVEQTRVEGTRQAWEAIVIASQQRPLQSPIAIEVQRGDETLTLSLAAEKSGTVPIERSFWRALWSFITTFDSRYPELAGLLSAVYGSIYIVALTALFSVPLGVGAAIYLEEYAQQSRMTSLIQVLIANLAGVPSVIYGIIGLEMLSRSLGLGRSILAGALTMSFLILPLVIIAAREALRSIPESIRHAAYGVGATRWQAIRHHVLPYALPGIFTGVILSLSRAIGEAAPLILLGAFQYVPFIPKDLFDLFTVIPIQIFTWVTLPQEGFANISAAAILVLLALLLLMNAFAIFLRIKFQRRW